VKGKVVSQPNNEMSDGNELAQGELWILVDETEEAPEGELARFRGRKRYSAEVLGDKLQDFTATLSTALSRIQQIGAGFELSEVSVDVRMSAQVGFELIAQAGIEGGITLTFRRPEISHNLGTGNNADAGTPAIVDSGEVLPTE
jgi:hypothetical protein